MRVKLLNSTTTLGRLDVGDVFSINIDGSIRDEIYIKTDERDDTNDKTICMKSDGILYRYSDDLSVISLDATLVVGDYNEED